VSTARISTYLDEKALPYFFCPGCGHGTITDKLNAALVRLQPDPNRMVIVTDIGCSGLTDKYFTTNAFHGLHGRSITYATGLKLANPDLKVIVLMGDGGCGIGGHHLINAARRNIGVSVVVFNNFNYGMTGGQHSVSTPPGGITSSTPFGQIERPMDIAGTAAVNGAGFAARATAFDQDLPDLLAEAISYDGFSVVDIWELCTAYYAPNNRFSKKALLAALEELGFPTGLIRHEERPEFSRAYRESAAGLVGRPSLAAKPVEQKYQASLTGPLSLLLAGAAGAKINTAAGIFCQGALLSGLYATLRSDYPVTVKSGHSTAEVIVSNEPVGFSGIRRPDRALVLFKEGLAVSRARIQAMASSGRLYLASDLPPVETGAGKIILNFGKGGLSVKKETRALAALAFMLQQESIYPLEALREAAQVSPAFADQNLAAIEAGLAL
jgi:2-oxoglutarate/2-oxoacid ferredoxin oxidoreductase subunit beta